MTHWRSNCFRSGVCCYYGADRAVRNRLETYRDIENSPVRNTYSIRDRVWEPVNQILCQMQWTLYPETHCEGGRVDVQLDTYSDQLGHGQIHKLLGVEKRIHDVIALKRILSLACDACTYE